MYIQEYKFADTLVTFVAINCNRLFKHSCIDFGFSIIRRIHVCSYIYNYPIYVEDQQQRSSNISLSPFRSNNNLEKLLVLLVSKVFCTNKLFLKASNWLSCKVYSVELGYYHTRTCSPSSGFIQWHNRKQFKIKRQSIFILGVILAQVSPEIMLHIYCKIEYSVRR